MKLKNLMIVLIVLISFGVFLFIQNNIISITRIKLSSDKLSKDFNGYRIVHLSDLHNKLFGKNQKDLLKRIKAEKPNIIVFTGDLIDRNRYDKMPAVVLMKGLVKIAPVFYVNGNHEQSISEYEFLEKDLINLGVRVLRNRAITVKKGTVEVNILGIDDPSFISGQYTENERINAELRFALRDIKNQKGYKILLSHRPEMFQIYRDNNIDLTFSGHAHGGQIRIPFVGGVIAPNQGIFPKYTSGIYTSGSSNLIVSRGLGNSLFPQRIFNRPEIIVLTLFSKKV